MNTMIEALLMDQAVRTADLHVVAANSAATFQPWSNE